MLKVDYCQFRLYRNDLTTEGAENAEEEKREMSDSDTTGFELIVESKI